MLATALLILNTFTIKLASAIGIGLIGLIAKHLFINPIDELITSCI